MGINPSIVLNQLGIKLKDYSSKSGEYKQIFNFNSIESLKSNKRTLSELLRHPCIRVQFDSSIGKFSLLLKTENLEEALDLCYKAREREFITMERLDLIEPISYSTIKVFSEFLKLDIREKSVTLQRYPFASF
jgi:hypothetical protein